MASYSTLFHLISKDKRRKNKSILRSIEEVIGNNIIGVEKQKKAI